MSVGNTYGRITIYAPYSEQELLSLDDEKLKTTILGLMTDIITIHDINKAETRALWDYYLGNQDILNKQKFTREEINNKKVENWAYALVDFKKNWLVGEPIQYTMSNNSSSDEIEKLNRYVKYEDKDAKDQELIEDVYVCGRGFRFVKKDLPNEDDEAPFSIANIKRDNCEVVYSSNLGNEQLFSVVETEMKERISKVDEITGARTFVDNFYSEYTIYLRNKMLTISYKGAYPQISKITPLILNEHLITEYRINRDRISLIEIGKDLFDGINQLESDDFDDLDQFVNAIMVFTNADIDEDGLKEMKTLGAIKIKSTENRKASVDELKQRLNASDTQVFYTRLLTALHQILGVPMATDNGSVTSGDTGKAKLTGQGFTSSGIRSKSDQTMIKSCDRKTLKVILKICREAGNSKIKKLRVSDVDIKFNIDKSENLLTKSEALNVLITMGVPKEYAVPLVNLFGDPTAVVNAWNDALDKQKKEQEQKQLEFGNNFNNQSNNINKNQGTKIEENKQTNQTINKTNNALQKQVQEK